MRDKIQNKHDFLKIKLSSVAWRNPATLAFPQACCWSVQGQRQKLVLRQSVCRGLAKLERLALQPWLAGHVSEVAKGQLPPCPSVH